jgi:hypothetical protein
MGVCIAARKRHGTSGVVRDMARRVVLFLFLAASVSCSTLAEAPDPGPQDHALAFGFLRVDNLMLDQEIQRIRIVQTGPPGSEARMDLSAQGNMFFTEPLPVGTCWRVVSLLAGDEERAVSLDFTADKAGLLFLGSFEIGGDAAESWGLRRRSTPSERQLLQDLLDAWRGTAWEAVIRARMSRI